MERFLVVDDDPDITGALSRVLQSMGFEVVAHTDSREAAKEKAFDVVLSDFMMPHLNGIELLGQLRVSNPKAIRLMLTAANDFKVALEAVNRGEVFRLLPKPWRGRRQRGWKPNDWRPRSRLRSRPAPGARLLCKTLRVRMPCAWKPNV